MSSLTIYLYEFIQYRHALVKRSKSEAGRVLSIHHTLCSCLLYLVVLQGGI
jgi:hypothetical protein